MKQFRLLTLLALLMTAATGAWAQTEELLTTITMSDLDGTIAYSVSDRATLSTSGLVENAMVAPNEVYGWSNSSPDEIGSVTITAAEGYEITKVVFWDYDFMEGYRNALTDNASPFTCYLKSSQRSLNENMSSASNGNIAKIEVYGYAAPAASTYTVSMKSGVKDADKWTVKVGVGQAQALPIGGLKGDGSETVTLQYNGRLKVKGVKATSDAAPAATLQSITVAKGSTDLSGDKLLYYTPGETYRQAIANHPENKLDGGLGWNIWENGSDATIFYKESADKSRDLSIDGDQHFRPTDSINLDTVIDPTLNFYFVAQF